MFSAKPLLSIIPGLYIMLLGFFATSVFATGTVHFQTNIPGLFNQSGTLQIALPLLNVGDSNAENVTVSTASLNKSNALSIDTPALGEIQPNQQAIFEAKFNSGLLSPNTNYLLTVKGSYQIAGRTYGYAVNRQIVLPSPPDGSNTLTSVPVAAVQTPCVTAPCIAQTGGEPAFESDEVNRPGPPVPTGVYIPASPSPSTADPVSAPAAGASGGVFFTQTTPNAPNPNSLFSGIPPDMSGASSVTCSGDIAVICRRLVVMSGNTFLAYSKDGGATFPDAQIVRPGNVYKDSPDGGFCCDQIIQYVPGINRYVWLIQTKQAATGPNRLRIALASPENLLNTGALAWTYYDLSSATFGIGNNWLDYPDLAVGNNYLYVSVDEVGTGLIVARLPLADLAAGKNTTVEYTKPEDGKTAYGGHLSQNALDGVYWAGHNTDSNMRIFRMPEGGNKYFWQSLNVKTWAKNNNYTSNAPDNLDWLAFGFPRASVMGAVRRAGANDLWLAWGAGRDNNFAQPHIEMARFSRNADGSVAFNNQVQIWNAANAFQYPALNTDSADHLAVGLAWGGGPSNTYGSFAVGFWGDFVVYYIDASNLTAAYDVYDNSTPPKRIGNQPRWGDYQTVRRSADPAHPFEFSAFGYAVKTDPADRDGCNTVATVVTGCKFQPQYIRFEFNAKPDFK